MLLLVVVVIKNENEPYVDERRIIERISLAELPRCEEPPVKLLRFAICCHWQIKHQGLVHPQSDKLYWCSAPKLFLFSPFPRFKKEEGKWNGRGGVKDRRMVGLNVSIRIISKSSGMECTQ